MQLNYKTFGQGDPLIILHGLFGTLDNWQTLAKRWAKEYTVFLVDQRNHGRSPHVDEHNYLAMAEDLNTFMEANWIHKAHILGHSMGGKTAMQFAVLYPEMVDKLIIIDIAPKEYSGGHEQIIEALNNLDVSQLQDRKTADAQLKTRIPLFGVRQFLLKNLTREKTGGYRWKMNLPALTQNYQAILQNIDPSELFEGPALFVKGDTSPYIKEEDLPNIQTYFPNAQLETIAEAGHWVHAEQPEQLFKVVRHFLEASVL